MRNVEKMCLLHRWQSINHHSYFGNEVVNLFQNWPFCPKNLVFNITLLQLKIYLMVVSKSNTEGISLQ